MQKGKSVAIYARYRKSVLLIKHTRLGQWLPVGGSVELEESLIDAARRELLEETGIVTMGFVRGLEWHHEILDPHKGHRDVYSFVSDVDTTMVRPNLEFTQFLWVSGTIGLACPANVHEIVRAIL